MTKGEEIYQVVAALVPLYMPVIIAYGSVRWLKTFKPDQCSGISRFVAMFSVPFVSFHFISSNDPYTMNYKFIAADTLQKVVILGALFLWNSFTKWGSLDWTLTLFSLCTLPNTMVMGVPILKAMYGESTTSLMDQIVVLQFVVWYTLLMFMYEYRAAKHLISNQFPQTETAGSITSLNSKELLQADAEMKENGELHVVVRSPSFNISSTEPIQRAISFNAIDLCKVNLQSDHLEEEMSKMHTKRIWRSKSCNYIFNRGLVSLSCLLNRTIVVADVPYEIAASRVQDEVINVSPRTEVTGEREVGIQYTLTDEEQKKVKIEGHANKKLQMTRLILIMVWRNLIKNPNTYASVLGLAWSLISFRWNIKMPSIIEGSITIFSNAGIGIAMFSLGLFMGLQPKIIACGKTLAAISIIVKFLVGPTVIATTSMAIGIRGVLLCVAIVQAALPQGIISFVFANEYNLHADILSTVVFFGMVVSLPTTIIYYVLLGNL